MAVVAIGLKSRPGLISCILNYFTEMDFLQLISLDLASRSCVGVIQMAHCPYCRPAGLNDYC